MPNQPALGELHRKHQVHESEQERSERALLRAEAENRDFKEVSREIAADISILQLGINEKTARTMAQGVIGQVLPNPVTGGGLPVVENPTLTRLREEKIQSGLYRAVQGNEIRETEFGEDETNYLGSANVTHLNRNLPRRAGAQMERFAHGAAAMIGGNNFVEAEVDRRFGANRNPEARRHFVSERMRPDLENLANVAPLRLQRLYAHVGMIPNPANLRGQIADFIDVAEHMRLSQLRQFREWCRGHAEPFSETDSFRDLMLFAVVDDEATTDSGLEAVYDHQRLRREWNDMRQNGGLTLAITDEINNILEPNSLFPLENNAEGKALLGELRVRMHRRPHNEVLQELQEIAANETQNAPITPDQRQRIDACANEMNALVSEGPGLADDVANLHLEVSNLEAGINLIGPAIATERRRVHADLAYVRNTNERDVLVNTRIPFLQRQLSAARLPADKTRLENLIKAEQARIVVLEQDNARISANLNQLEANRTAMTAALATANSNYTEAAKKLRANAQAAQRILTRARVWPRGPSLSYMHILANVDLNQAHTNLREINIARTNLNALTANLVPQLETAFATRERLSPFVLLQRWMRRDYCISEGLNPNLFNEEANHYATVKAALRVEDIKSIDRKRSANDLASEFLNRGILKRGWNKLRLAVSKGQDFVGLEPFDIKYQTSDQLLDQIIKSKPEFAAFKGINKFTTTRDLRDILNKSGKEVPPEVLEAFAETLQEAISRYKHVPPSLDKGLNPDHWDLETVVTVFKKLKAEIWSRKQLGEIGNAANRELALVSNLKGARRIDEEISRSIREEVKHPDAMWRKFLVKDALKALLNKDELESWKKIRGAGIDGKKQEIAKKEAALATANDATKQKLNREIENLRSDIKAVESQISEGSDLYDRVEKAREYIRENKLSRKQKKQYLEEVGLTQVFDKMSTNFRMQRAWHYTKRGGAAAWSGTKKAWGWSRQKFLNWETAKSGAKKTFSITRLAATPATWTLGKAWKYGTFPARLSYRALRRATHMPKRLAGVFSRNMMRSYLRDRIENYDEQIAKIHAKQAKLTAKIPLAPYSWDKKRLMRRINQLEEQKVDLMEASAGYKKIAADKKIELGSFSIYGAPANDNAKAEKKPNKAA